MSRIGFLVFFCEREGLITTIIKYILQAGMRRCFVKIKKGWPLANQYAAAIRDVDDDKKKS
jgi:hypothetical protein